MDISSALLAAHLQRLSGDRDQAVRLASGLHGLGEDVAVWVPSWLSVSIVLDGEPDEIDVSILRPGIDVDAGVPVLSSLAVEVWDRRGGAQLIVRAGHPGAFLLLADALTTLLHPAHPLVIDQHLDLPPTDREQAAGIADRATLDQAVGVLLEQGFVGQDGRRELHRLAASGAVSLVVAAAGLLNAQTASHRPDDVDTG